MSYHRYQQRRSSRPIVILVGVVIVVALLSAGGILWAMSANRGTIEKPSGSKATANRPKLLNYDSPYIAFQYSSAYQLVKQVPGGTSLEMSMLTADTNYEKRLAVAVFPLDANNLDTFSPYAIRKAQPNLYTHKAQTNSYARSDVTVDGGSATVFAKNDGSEVTAILLHNGKVVTLSLTTTSGYDDLTAEVDNLLPTFRWKQ